MRAIVVIVGLAAGNFLAKYTGDGNYVEAFERSFFQAWGIGAYALYLRFE